MKNQMKRAGLLFLFLASTIGLFGQGTWTTKKPMPIAQGSGGIGTIGGKIYVANGAWAFATEAYDPATDEWTTGLAAPPVPRAGVGSAVLNGKLYVVGGCFVAQGCIPGITNAFDVYDPATNAWTVLPPMPTPRQLMAVGAIGGKLYVAGGIQQCGPCNPQAMLEVYDPATNSWATKAPMPVAQGWPTGAVVDGIFYVMEGAVPRPGGNGTPTTLVQAYDPVTDTWSTRSSSLVARTNAGAAVIGNRIYITGGSNANGSDSSFTEVYDTTTDSWSLLPNLPTPRYLPSVAAVDGVLYAMAGCCDSGGNTFAVNEAFRPVDLTPPSISCAAPTAGWHANDEVLSCTAEDRDSGLANPSDSSFSLTTVVSIGSETQSASTDSRIVCDTAGNCATAGPYDGIWVDKKAPEVTISSPAGSYLVGQVTLAAYHCNDGGSGVNLCAGNVASGAPADTASAGAKTFIVNARDNVGNMSSQSAQYSVHYGLCLLYDPSKARPRGSTMPVKLRLCDAQGNNVSSAAVTVRATELLFASTNAALEIEDAGQANPEANFRYDSDLKGYIFNLSTRGLATGTYVLRFTVSDDTALHSVSFQIR